MSVVPLLDSEDEETEGERRRRLRSYRAALERHFGLSPVFIASAFGEHEHDSKSRLLKEAIINVVSCAYEERTRWGKEVPVLSFLQLLSSPACSGSLI